jgi:hypothetical protein
LLARLPWTKPATATLPKVARINKDRRAHIERVVAMILARGEPTQFAYEATCRHAVRSRLCLAGWRWTDADEVAAGVVAAALKRIGAQRPTWKQGQHEWTQDGYGPIERTRCVRCNGPLPVGCWKFCCQPCAVNHHHRLEFLQSLQDGAAYDAVVQQVSFWRNTK